MKKHILLLLALLFTTWASAQTQQGYVKTKGRMVNGQHVPGQGLKGATVTIKGRTAVLVEKDDGLFSFPVPAQTFMFQSVQKNGYELVDVDALKKTYNYSTNPIYILMETPEQQMQDLLDSERKIRRTLQRQLQQREDELEALKEANRITLEEYQQALQQLYADQENNEKLIASMAKRYAELDYDQIDDFYRQVYYYIQNGELVKADSLLNTKGDIIEQAYQLQQQGEAIRESLEQLQRAQTVQEADIEELARRCFSKYETLMAQYLSYPDTAFLYLVVRAELDTTNAQWQYDVGMYDFKHYDRQILYMTRALNLYKSYMEAGDLSYEPMIASALERLARTYEFGDCMLMLLGDRKEYEQTIKLDLSEALYKESLEIYRRLAKSDPQQYTYDLFGTLHRLAYLYKQSNQYEESEAYYNEAIEIYQNAQLQHIDESRFSFTHWGDILTEVGELYALTGRYNESENLYESALSYFYDLDQSEALKNMFSLETAFCKLLDLYDNLYKFEEAASIIQEVFAHCQELMDYYKDDDENVKTILEETFKIAYRFDSSIYYYDTEIGLDPDVKPVIDKWREDFYKGIYDYYQTLFQENPDRGLFFFTELVKITRRMSYFYRETGHMSESIEKAAETVRIYRWITSEFNSSYEINLADALNDLGVFAPMDSLQLKENSYQEAIEIYRRWVQNDIEVEPSLANTLNNLANLYRDINRLGESEQSRKEAKEIFGRWTIKDPSRFEPTYAQVLFDLGYLYFVSQRYAESQPIFAEAIELYRRLSDSSGTTSNNLLFSVQFMGLSYFQVGQFQESIPFFEESLHLLRLADLDDFQKQQLQFSSLLSLSMAYGGNKNYNKAYETNEELIPIIEAMRQHDGDYMSAEYSIILNSQSYYALFLDRFPQSEQYAREAIAINPSDNTPYTNLAASLLLQSKYAEAEQIYRQYKSEFKDNFLQDLAEFEAAGVIPKERKADVERIRQMLNE